MPEPISTDTAVAVDTPATTPGTTVVPSPGTPDPTRTSAAPTGFTYQEDRSKWIPPHRLSEESTKRQGLEAQIAERDKKIAALAGVSAPDANASKKAEVEKAFFEMFPHLTREKMEELGAQAGAATAAEARQWSQHGKAQMASIYTAVAEQLGAESLSADQKADLQDGFAKWLKATCSKELQESGGESSATLAAYEDGDPKVVGAFVKRYSDNWVEPARRKVTAQTLGRTRPVPDSTGRSQVTSVKRPEKFANIDERIAYASDLAAERGFNFDNRS